MQPQTVEMYYHRSGFHPPHETIATHARKRYRLVPSANANPGLPPPDPQLWIIHYSQSERQHQLPANRIPVNPQVQHLMTQRKYLQQHGQLVRKEFMLHDRNNWPNINLPGNSISQPWSHTSSYPNNVISQMNRNHPSYITQQQAASQGAIGPSPAKRQRQVGPPHTHGQSRGHIPGGDLGLSMDDEDTGNGDFMDTLTPRDISAHRYIKHHEWMEEIFSSPYGTSQIVPVELGLGRKGEIENLTKDFFETPTSSERNVVKGAVPPRVGRLEDDKASDFTVKATERVAQLNGEMERLKIRHAKRTAKLRQGDVVKQAEQQLRKQGGNKYGNGGNAAHTDDIVETIKQVQELLGKSIRMIKDVECTQRGGLEEKSQANDSDHRSFDLDHSMQDLPSEEPQSTPQHVQPAPSNGNFDSAGHTPQLYPKPPVPGDGAEDQTAFKATSGEDITMAEIPAEVENKDGEPGDWIIVNKEGDSRSAAHGETPDVSELANDGAMEGEFEAPGDGLDTTGDALEGFAPDQGVTDEFNPDDFHDTVDFGSLDTAGEGLSGFAVDTNAEIGLDEHGDLGLDDSAFVEAFHAPTPSEQQETGGGET